MACQGTSDQARLNVNAPLVPSALVKTLFATSFGTFGESDQRKRQLITNRDAAIWLADAAIWLTCLFSVWVMILFWPVSRIDTRNRTTSNASGAAYRNRAIMLVS